MQEQQYDMLILEDTRRKMNNNCYTYLNSGLLKAPRKNVLHGLIPGLTPFWPHPPSMHLVATPTPVSCCLLQGFKIHPNITTTLHDTCTHVHHTSITIHSSSYTSSIFLGRLAVLHLLCPLQRVFATSKK
jgi:hypothetical protein